MTTSLDPQVVDAGSQPAAAPQPQTTRAGIPRTRRYRWRRRAITLILVPAIVLACLSQPLIPQGSLAALVVRVVAWLAFLAGGGLRLWATLYIGGRKSESVITEGPYSICRNPLYVGTFLIGVALALFLQSLLVLVAVVLGMAVYASGTIPAEEVFLGEKFGAPYSDYLRRTPRYLPSFRLYRSPQFIDVNLKGLRKELIGACGWLLIPLIGDLLNYGRQQPWWPDIFQLP